MCRATGVEPTNEIALTSGCASRASTASRSPWTTLNTPSGSPASRSSSAIRSASDGSRSEGFSTKQLPQASASGNIHSGTIAGKLKGVIPAHTPSGWRSEWQSTSAPTFSLNSPLSKCGIPVANSITSMPRVTEPSASASVLPCSSVTMAASSCLRASIRSRKRIRIRARRSGGAARQSGHAASAAPTAASTSPASASGTRRTTAPVAGLKTSACRRLREVTARPPIHSGRQSRRSSVMDISPTIAPFNRAAMPANSGKETQ